MVYLLVVAATAVGEVLPDLKGRLDGFAMRVPTPNVSLVDLNAIVDKKTTAVEVNAALRDAARRAQSELKPQGKEDVDGARQVALAAVGEVFDTAARLLEDRELDVAWVSADRQRGAVLRVAPMSVAMA